MTEALLILKFIEMAMAVGVNLADYLTRVSDLVRERHAAGKTVSQDDLDALMDDGDLLEAKIKESFRLAVERAAAGAKDPVLDKPLAGIVGT